MTTTVACPHCKTSLKVRSENAAGVIRCPRCQKSFRLAARPAPAVPNAVPKAAPAVPKAAPAPRAPARGARAPTPPADDSGTLDGQFVPPAGAARLAAPTAPPPVRAPSRAAPSAPPDKGGGLLWAVLGSLLALLLVGGGFAGYYFWKLQPGTSPGGDNPSPTPAVNAALGKWGAVEIGSKGIKAMVLEVFESADADGYDFSVVWKADANPTLVAAKAGTGDFDPKALSAVEDHVRQFYTTIRDKHGVVPQRIYVLSSSGLWVPFFGNHAALTKNRAALSERVKAATGSELHFVSASQEARLGMKSCVPPKDWKEAVFLDIGSGNVKGGYFESDEVFEGVEVDVGSVTFVKKVMATGKPPAGKSFVDQLAGARPALLEQPLRQQMDRMPGLATQKKVHLAGGAVWALATCTHPNDPASRVELTAADIERFAILVRRPESEVRNDVLAQVKDPEQWKKVSKEIARVQKIFKPDNLQAAAEILKGLSGEFRFADKRLFFFRKSHLAWPLGFVLEKNKIQK